MERWTGQKILEWAESRFGACDAGEIAVRMNKEAAELLSGLQNGAGIDHTIGELADLGVMLKQIRVKVGRTIDPFGPSKNPKAEKLRLALRFCDANIRFIHSFNYAGSGKAFADCRAMEQALFDLCAACEVDLHHEVDNKMDINEKRQWEKADDGSYQHV